MKCRMQCTPNKIIRYMLTAPPKFHVGVNEFKYVGLLPVEYRVEKLNYLRTNIDTNMYTVQEQVIWTKFVSIYRHMPME